MLVAGAGPAVLVAGAGPVVLVAPPPPPPLASVALCLCRGEDGKCW